MKHLVVLASLEHAYTQNCEVADPAKHPLIAQDGIRFRTEVDSFHLSRTRRWGLIEIWRLNPAIAKKPSFGILDSKNAAKETGDKDVFWDEKMKIRPFGIEEGQNISHFRFLWVLPLRASKSDTKSWNSEADANMKAENTVLKDIYCTTPASLCHPL